ncbi:MAG TPA: hypothetical protein VH020_14320 [Stellaceae bacterium]|jgi:hypothetical protein|nr:hypothetical protein [Stellaceae bacterium]
MRWFPIALTLLPLAGCVHTATHEFASCDRKASHAYPTSAERPAYLDEIRVCMAINGFDYKASAERCAGAPSEANHACYVPSEGFEHFLYQHGLSSAVD